jgi:type IV fimbrial biogenesis protein FimT
VAHRSSGYSLLELLITCTVVAIGVQAGLGLFELVERNRRWQAISELQRLVNFSRSEAVTRQLVITLCALDSASECSADWEGRDIAVFADGNRNRRLDEGEALLLSHWPELRGRLRWRASLGRRYLEYSALGSTYQNGSFVLCREDSVKLVMRINRGGRPYFADTSGYQCN